MTQNEQDLPEWAKHITLHGLAVSIDMDTTNRLVKALRHSQEQVAKLREALENLHGVLCRMEAPTSHKAVFRELHGIVNTALAASGE